MTLSCIATSSLDIGSTLHRRLLCFAGIPIDIFSESWPTWSTTIGGLLNALFPQGLLLDFILSLTSLIFECSIL